MPPGSRSSQHSRIHLATLRVPDLPPGPTIERTAVRGILFRDTELLLLASRHGDYKFPGGGAEVASIREQFPATDAEYAVFAMTSHYFSCSGGTRGRAQALEGYEAELRLMPVWATVTDAPMANRQVLAGGVGVMRWLARETAVLEWLSGCSR